MSLTSKTQSRLRLAPSAPTTTSKAEVASPRLKLAPVATVLKDDDNDNPWTDSPQAKKNAEIWKNMNSDKKAQGRDDTDAAYEAAVAGTMNPTVTTKDVENKSLTKVAAPAILDSKLEPANPKQPATPNEKFSESLREFQNPVTVRELSQDEWNALSPEKQKSVIANFAIYQAAQEDKKVSPTATHEEGYDDAVNAIFTENGGSDKYAPNTIKVLQELGYTNPEADLDNFLDGSALANEADINGTDTSRTSKIRQGVFDGLGTASGLNGPDLQSALEAGSSILDSIRDSSTVGSDLKTYAGLAPKDSGIPAERESALQNVLTGMASKSVWDRVQTDPETNNALRADLEDAMAGLDPSAVAAYFDKTYKGQTGDDKFMSYDDFAKNWLRGA